MRYLFSITIFIIILAISGCSDDKQVTETQNTALSSISQTNASRSDTFDIPFTEDPVTATIEYPDTNIYYDANGIIYSYNPKIKEKKEIIYGHGALLSHDKTKFIYFPYLWNELPKGASMGSFYMYNVITKTNKLLFINDREDGYSYQNWSPDDKYIMFNAGTGVIRDIEFIDANTGNSVFSLYTFDPPVWLNDNEIVYTNIDNPSPEPITNVCIYNFETKTKKVITPDKKDINYGFLEVTLEGKIRFSSHERKDKDSNFAIFWVADIDGKNIIKEKEVEDFGEEIRKENISSEYDKWYFKTINALNIKNDDKYNIWVIPLSNKSDWVLIHIGTRITNNYELWIMNIKNPKSLKKITECYSATW